MFRRFTLNQSSMLLIKNKRSIINILVLFLSLLIVIPTSASNLRISVKGHLDSEEPILFYSNKHFDIYTDQESIQISSTALPNLAARLYFVLKDEPTRQAFVKEMQNQREKQQAKSIESMKQSVMEETILSSSEKEKKMVREEKRIKAFYQKNVAKNIKDLKYITLTVQYIAKGRLSGVAGRQPLGPKDIPLLIINNTIYNAPVTRSNIYYQKGLELILTDNTNNQNPAYINQRFNHWDILTGDLDPIYDSIRLDEKEYPDLHGIIQELIRKISTSQKKVPESGK